MTDKEEELKKQTLRMIENYATTTDEKMFYLNLLIQEGKAEAEKEQECKSCGCKTNILFCADCCLDRNEVIRLKHTFIDILKDEIEFLESLLREDDVFALLCERLSQLKSLNSQLEIEPKGNIKPSADSKEKTI